MSSDGLSTALGAIASALFVLIGFYVYISLVRQIAARRAVEGDPGKQFGFPEIICAIALAGWFLLNVALAIFVSRNPLQLSASDLLLNLAFSLALLVFLAVFLRLRGFEIGALAGFSHPGFARLWGIGFLLLLAAYPLVGFTDALVQRFFGVGSGKQEIVELFGASPSLEQRAIIICLAVAIAPITEEFIFRFFFYGLLKRYFGKSAGLFVNSLFFAGVHAHLPSFAPLFVLGACFTIAYEWSGSILVSMTMHALFNSASLIALAFPQSTP